MSLKQSIIVKSQFNVRGASGDGSRGNTPGDYVKRYAARADATEELAPVRLGAADRYIQRYMAREDATEVATDDREGVPVLKGRYRSAQKLGGRTFGPEGPSLSHDELVAKSAAAQRAFDEGATIIMPIFSFTNEYLEEMGVVPEGFECARRGDYRGNVDQMRLRLAIADGMKRMCSSFDDPDWVCAIQVDTKHVHCHAILWDRGRGRLMPNGEQRGKLTPAEMLRFRRGLDLSLQRTSGVRMLSANITDDRRNVKCFVKRYAHDVMLDAGPPQFLLACLPEDRRLWRVSSSRKEMRKPNELVREFVNAVLEQPGSGWTEAVRDIAAYARARAEREGLDIRGERRLVDNGRQRAIDDCCNGVYDVLRQLPREREVVRTPLLDVMGMEYADAASIRSDDPMVEFGFRLRSYSSRLEHHRKEHRRYADLVKGWDEAYQAGEAEEDSRILRDFYDNEASYHGMLMAKYQHFLAFLPDEPDVDRALAELEGYGRRRDRLSAMLDDDAIARFSPEGAEEYGKRVYGQNGGRFLVTGMGQVMETRLERMQESYRERLRDINDMLADYARKAESTYENGPDGHPRLRLKMRREVAYPFDEVKALDMHHMAYDFPYAADVSLVNVEAFAETYEWRREGLDAAVEYLERTGQADYVQFLPVADVEAMGELAGQLSKASVLPSARVAAAARRPARTVALTDEVGERMKAAVRATVASVADAYSADDGVFDSDITL